MSVVSNQYAAKIFSEHPTAVWPLDDRANFLSIISDSQKNISSAAWTKDKCSVSAISNPALLPSQKSPFSGQSAYYEISGDHTQITAPNTKIEVLLSNAVQSQLLNENLKTFYMNFYVFQQSTFAESYEFGYRYFDTVAGVNIERTKTVQASEFQEWINLSETFNVSEFDSDQLNFFIRFYVSPGGTLGEYKFIVHGLSIAQWSEIFASEDTGTYPQTLPLEVGIGPVPSISADQYGPLSDNAYYICESARLLAQNEGIPLVFGSKNATRLYASENSLPSLVFPGKGMFSEKNKYQSMSLEFWMRIKPNTKNPKRIFGPLDSNYGIYVSEGYLSLSVGDTVKGYNVSEWYRPMLVHLIYTQNSVSLLINSEKVIEIEIDVKSFSYIENEWFGFFNHEDIEIFEIDCISIFPYVVPLPVAKRRFVWGQGVDPENLIDSYFKGTVASVSFPNAKYSSNMIYPDKERWDAGYYNNLAANTKFLSSPEFTLPSFPQTYLNTTNSKRWHENNKTINDFYSPGTNDPKFITLRPNITTRTNLITNSSFESDTAGWLGGGCSGTNLYLDSSNYLFGTKSLRCEAIIACNSRAYFSVTGITVTAGTPYTFSAYTKAQTTPRLFDLIVEWYSSSNTYLGFSETADIINSTSTWTRQSLTATAPINAVRAIPSIRFISVNALENHYIDGVLFETGSTLLPYFDGTTVGQGIVPISRYWNGNAHASTSSMTYWTSGGPEWNTKGYLNFSSSNVTSLPFNTIYGVFGVNENILTSRPLIHIVNTLTEKRFEINIENNLVVYKLDGTIVKTVSVSGVNNFVAGIHVPYLLQQLGEYASSFFSSYDSLQVFIGGAPDTTSTSYSTFEGKIYKFAVDNAQSFEMIQDEFSSDGFAISNSFQEFIDHSSMYSVSPFDQYGNFFLDISIYSTWEEYYPLSYFAQYVDGFNNKKYYDVDFLQFNLGYPSYAKDINFATESSPWDNYAELDYYFAYPVQQFYEDLDNVNISGFETYEDLDLNRKVQNILDLSESSIKTYATFQLLAEGSDEPLSSFSFTAPLPKNKVVDAGFQNTLLDPYKAYRTKFEITDGSIIYPPKNISMENVSLNLHFVIDKKAILSNPLIIRDMEISSKALSRVSKNPIGTKFENDIVPYTKSGIYYSYKSKNPYSIFKKSMPYLYLTENSGIKMLQFSDNFKEYGSQIKINPQQEQNFYLGATQLFIKYDIKDIPSAPVTIFEIEYKEGTVEFVSEKDDSGLRSKVFARDKSTKAVFSNVSFYQNGIKVSNPYLVYNQWNVLGIVFEIPLDLKGYAGSINIFAGLTFNNISSYRSEGLNEISSVVARLWQDIRNDGPTNYDWRYWYDKNGTANIQTWRNLYTLASNQYYSLSAKDIFNTYAGTNINIFDDNTGIVIENEISTIISNVSWSSLTEKPV